MQTNNQWTVSSVFGLTLLVTAVLYCSGLFSVSYLHVLPPELQNLAYAIGRIPLLFTTLWFVLAQDHNYKMKGT